ncbi:protein phosphatase 2C domain-containing protein [Streptomyces sp. NPDC021020]|uniref:protein phosphatase 2C domain-containing protein n=1 Tax=Streptomyces sp. NPDC021020 TaxID=3365109 RepID=UPI0037A5B03D
MPGAGEPYRSLADAFAPPARAVPPAVGEPETGADPTGAPALRPAAAGGVSPGAAPAPPSGPAAIEPPAARAELPPPAEAAAWGETAYAEGGVRWAPELPPGWVAAAEEEPAAAVVGGGPPTYAAEPTAWPEADPEGLDGLVPDTVLDGAQYAGMTLRTVSLRGDSARYRGQPRRDALLTARFGTGDDALLLVAMASGARAADDAHRAAQDAVRWIAGAVGRSRERLAGDLRAGRRGALKSGLHRLTDRCYGRLRARGEDLGLEDGAYTAALRCLLLPVDPRCPIRLFFGVGDGGLFRVRDGAWQDLDVAPEDSGSPFRFRATSAQPGDALLMCSAGLAEPLRGEPELATLLAERWGGGRAPGLAGYLADVQTRVKGYADDRTAATVWDA